MLVLLCRHTVCALVYFKMRYPKKSQKKQLLSQTDLRQAEEPAVQISDLRGTEEAAIQTSGRKDASA